MIFYIQKSIDTDAYVSFLKSIFQTEISKDESFNNLLFEKYFNVPNNNFIYVRGENQFVSDLLNSFLIDQKNIILITCTIPEVLSTIYKQYYKNKNIFIPKYSENNNYLTKYYAEDFDMGFDPCMAEIRMARDIGRRNFKEMLHRHFTQSKYYELLLSEGRKNGKLNKKN